MAYDWCMRTNILPLPYLCPAALLTSGESPPALDEIFMPSLTVIIKPFFKVGSKIFSSLIIKN